MGNSIVVHEKPRTKFEAYVHETKDVLLVLIRLVCDLREGIHRSLCTEFTDEEAEEFYALEDEKRRIVCAIGRLVRSQKARIDATIDYLKQDTEDNDSKYNLIAETLTQDISEEIDAHILSIDKLRTEYEIFGNKMKRRYGEKSKKN